MMQDPLEYLQAQQSQADAADGQLQLQLPGLSRLRIEVDPVDPAHPDEEARAENAAGDALNALLAEGDVDLRAVVAEIQARLLRDAASSERHLWEIEIAQTCFRNWRNLGHSIRRAGLRLMRLFIEGREERSRVNHAKPLEHAVDGLGLFESYMGDSNEVRGYRLLWEEVWGWSDLYNCWRDKIVIWGVRHHDKVGRLVSKISDDFRRRMALRSATWPRPPPRRPVPGATRRPRQLQLPPGQACPDRDQQPGVVDPNYTLRLDALAPVVPDNRREDKASDVAQADLPVLRQVKALAEQLARWVLAGREAHPDLSPAQRKAIRDELEIICANGPLAVSGRSGTGKTACAITRLWVLEHAYWYLGRGTSLFPSGHLRAVYITKSGPLLDKVRKDLSSMEPKHVLLAPEQDREWQAEADQLIGSGDRELADVASLAAVTDDMYPLFVSRRTWLRLLNGMLQRPFLPQQNAECEEIDYEIFETRFWPRLLPKGAAASGQALQLHALLCWTEFLSLLAGSAESLCDPQGYVSLKKYQEMGKTRSRMANDDQRRAVHDMYKRYRDLKAQDKKYKYDITDVVHHIYHGIKKDGFHGAHLHEIIIDEVQDFTAAELGVVSVAAADLSGLFFCGDTCQTVASGLVFRDPFRRLNLSLSYRSHHRTLSCAAVAVDMLQTLFPKELDEDLPRDAGMRDGPSPLLVLGSDEPSLMSFLFADVEGKRSFGADQVVIIREEQKRGRIKQLDELLGAAVVLTVEEAKGLEFQDVLLFNFFADAAMPDEPMWKEAVSAAEEEVLKRADEAAGRPSQERRVKAKRGKPFDPLANRLVAAALKLLYTSITRAITSIWVYDDSNVRKPMFQLFIDAKVVQTVESGEKRGVAWQRDTGRAPSDWKRLGDQLFERQTYEMAARAYRNANEESLA
eukprot:tig00020713_g13400.t1